MRPQTDCSDSLTAVVPQSLAVNGQSQSRKRKRPSSTGTGVGNSEAVTTEGKVIRVTGLGADVHDGDLVQAFAEFGPVSYVRLTEPATGLVEFEERAAADRCLAAKEVEVFSGPVQVSMADVDSIDRKHFESSTPTRTLMLTVVKPDPRMSLAVVHTVCNQVKPVIRIQVSYNVDLFQALVEFPSPAAARTVKHELNGREVHPGCNMLKVEFSAFAGLNVEKNDQFGWDYTVDMLLSQTKPLHVGTSAGGENSGTKWIDSLTPVSDTSTCSRSGHVEVGESCGSEAAVTPTMEKALVLVTNVPEQLDCDHLFNLFCLYGDVKTVIFLPDVPAAAVIELKDAKSADRAVHFLNGAPLYGNKLNVALYKRSDAHSLPRPADKLKNGEPAWKSFHTDHLKRFRNPDLAAKNRLISPQKGLYFFNAPTDITEQKLHTLFKRIGGPRPNSAVVFTSQNSAVTYRTARGAVEFETVDEACQALCLANHAQLQSTLLNSSSQPYIHTIKFNFRLPSQATLKRCLRRQPLLDVSESDLKIVDTVDVTAPPADVEDSYACTSQRSKVDTPVTEATIAGGNDDPSSNAVVIITNVDRRANCDRIYNLLCLYGNVAKVLFVTKKSDTVVVQMADRTAAERVVKHLKDVSLFGRKLAVERCKAPYVEMPNNSHLVLNDGTPYYKDYSASFYHRFGEHAAASRIVGPDSTVFFCTAAGGVSEHMFFKVFQNVGAPLPIIRLGTLRSEDKTTGSAQFNCVADAVTAIALANHTALEVSGDARFANVIWMSFCAGDSYGGNTPLQALVASKKTTPC